MKMDIGRFVPIIAKSFPLIGRFVPILFRLFLVFEWLAPVFATYFFNKTLGGWKARGLIDDYGAAIVREGRLRYKIEIRIGLTTDQARNMFEELFAKALGKT